MKGISLWLCVLLASCLLFADLSVYERTDPRLSVMPILKSYDQIEGFQAQTQKWDRDFKGRYGAGWRINIDIRSGRPGHVYGAGVPLIPGPGNDLPYDHPIQEDEIITLCRGFLKSNTALFGIDADALAVRGAVPVDDFWYVNLQQTISGVPVTDAMVLLTISHGNLVSFSTHKYDDVAISPKPIISGASAQSKLFQEIGGRLPDDRIIDPGTLMVLPIAKNGSTAFNFTGGVGDGYGHLLAWQILFERPGEGTWRALVDAHANSLLSLNGTVEAAGESTGQIKGRIHYFSTPYSLPTTGTFGMPYMDVRYAYPGLSCYYSDGEQMCKNTGDYCIPELVPGCDRAVFGRQYVTNASGVFGYSSSDSNAFQTRLSSPFIRILQNYSKKPPADTPHCDRTMQYNAPEDTYTCITEDHRGIIDLDGGTDEFPPDVDECSYWEPDFTNELGNSDSSRSAFFHGNFLKLKWLDYMPNPQNFDNKHDPPVCSPGNTLACWLISPTPIYVNNGYPGAGDAYLDGLIYLLPNGSDTNNSAKIPSILYHELGHGINHFDGLDYPETGPSSSEGYSDIVAAIMTRDSCIGRGWIKNSNTACWGNGDIFPCTGCGGYRDIDYSKHSGPATMRTIGQCISDSTACPLAPGSPGDKNGGPCRRNKYCEGEIVSQAFWDMKNYLKQAPYNYSEATAWEVAGRLFRKAIHQLGAQFYDCFYNADDDTVQWRPGEHGCLATSMFHKLLEADNADGSTGNMPPHGNAIIHAMRDHELHCQATINALSGSDTCPAIGQPQIIGPISTANHTAYLTWEAVSNAVTYDIMRNPFGADVGFLRVGNTSGTSYFDEGLMNDQTYWYRIVPLGASRSCIGPVSEALAATPSASLMVLPETQDDWLVNAYRRRKLQAWGGSGAYTWSIAAGALPLGIFLDNVTGELYGQPITVQQKRWVTIRATDTPTGLYGDRRYNIGATSSVPWLDFTPTFLPSARVSDGTMNTYYSVALLPSSGVTSYSFAAVPGEGDLPPGLSCGCYWKVTPPNPPKYLCTIEGRVSCSGFPAPCTERGLYTFTVRMTGTLNNRTGTVDRTFDLPVYDATEGALVVPSEGTTAGGTPVKVFFKSNLFSTDTYARFEMPAGCGVDVPCTASLPPESFNIVSENTTTNDRYLMLTTPRSLEGDATLRIYIPTAMGSGVSGASLPSDFRFITPAYASSTMAGTVHVLDTAGRDQASPPLMDQTPMDSIPLGMALSDGTQPGRELYAADIGTGNLLVFSASESRFEQSVTLQDPEQPYFGWGAVDVAVDSRGNAYVAHTTAGLEQPRHTFPPEPWNPEPGGISVVNLALRAIEDADGDPATGSSSAPVFEGERLSRIGGTLYPYTISTLRLDRPQEAYLPGDGYPGEYAFVSGVGPQPPEPISQTCWCQQGKFMMPCGNPGPCDCPPDFLLKCLSSWDDRPLRIGIVDLNPWRVKTAVPWVLESNPDYWKYLGNCDPGTGGQLLGFSNQGLDFSVSADGLGATVYAVSPHEDIIYTFDFLDAVNDPSSFPYSMIHLICEDDLGLPLLCGPVDIKVQTIGGQAYALVANENGGALTMFPISGAASEQTLGLWSCDTPSGFWPTPKAVDARGDGSVALVAAPQSDGASETGGITVVSLGPPMSMDAACRIPLPYGPDRILIGPMSTTTGLAATITAGLTAAAPSDFTVPQQQDILIREWETVHHLQETSANPQAVVVNIDNFQRSVNRWMSNTKLQTDLNRAVDLYRAAYLKDHPTGSVQ